VEDGAMKARLEVVTGEGPREQLYVRGSVHVRVNLTIEGVRGEPIGGAFEGARKTVETTLREAAVKR
jgi:hypothetical protein